MTLLLTAEGTRSITSRRGATIHYQGRWAVVTGASSGLGRGLAARLADRGMSLVLTGRNEMRLNETAQQIRAISVVESVTCRSLGAQEQHAHTARRAEW